MLVGSSSGCPFTICHYESYLTATYWRAEVKSYDTKPQFFPCTMGIIPISSSGAKYYVWLIEVHLSQYLYYFHFSKWHHLIPSQLVRFIKCIIHYKANTEWFSSKMGRTLFPRKDTNIDSIALITHCIYRCWPMEALIFTFLNLGNTNWMNQYFSTLTSTEVTKIEGCLDAKHMDLARPMFTPGLCSSESLFYYYTTQNIFLGHSALS